MKIDTYSGSTGNVSSGEATGLTSSSFANVKSFSDLKPGDKFKAVVTDITPSQVTLKLASGNSLTAKSLILPEARIGEESIFAVKENFKGQILLEMLKPDNNILQTNIVKEALKNASLVATKENIDLVLNLVKNGIPVDQETLHKAVFFNYSKTDVTTDQVLFLLKEGFEPSESNVSVLNNIMDKSLGLEKSLKDIITGIILLETTELKKDLIGILLKQAMANDAATVKLTEDFINTSNKEGNMVQQTGEQIESDLENHIKFPKESYMKGSMKDQIGDQTNSDLVHSAEARLNSNIDELIERLMSRSSAERREAEQILNNELGKRLFIDLKDDRQVDRKELGIYFKELAQTIKLVSDRLKQEHTSVEPLSADQGEILANKTNASSNMAARPDEQILRLDGLISNVTENMKFMSQIHNYKEYMQIPFSVNGEKNQGELYVFKNAKGAGNFKEQASILIAVDFAVLGRVECFVNKINKNLNFDFRLENNNIIGLIKKGSTKLFDILGAKGYKITGVTFRKIETEHKLTDDIISSNKTSGDKRYAFDMRV